VEHDEFIGQVQARARLDSRGAAETATRATLETLGERIPEGLATNLGAQLPIEIGRHLEQDRTERYELDEFWRRVTERERPGVEFPDAAFHSRAVVSVVAEAITGSGVDRLKDALTPEWEPLFEFPFET